MPTETEIVCAIERAARTAILELFEQHHERFYYLTLVTTGHGHSPVLSAWSFESLEAATSESDDKASAIWSLKWSYADSPYYCFGERYFQPVMKLFCLRPEMGSLPDTDRRDEYEFRLSAMERAMAQLDREGLFGKGEKRNQVVVSVEVMPPDHSNTVRAQRLNPAEAIREWLIEAAE